MHHTLNLHSLGVTQLTPSNHTAIPTKVMQLWDSKQHAFLEWHYNPLTHKVEVLPHPQQTPAQDKQLESTPEREYLERCMAELDCKD